MPSVWVQMLVTAVRAERQSRARAAVEEDMATV